MNPKNIFSAVLALSLTLATAQSGPASGWPPIGALVQAAEIKDTCKNPEACLDIAVREIDNGNYTGARSILEGLSKRLSKGNRGARASFLLALIGLKDGRDDAEPLFHKAMGLSNIKDYVLFYMAEYQSNGGKTFEAVKSYERLLRDYPGSVLRPEAMYRKSVLLMERGDFKGAAKGFLEVTEDSGEDKLRRTALLNLARCYDGMGDYDRAADALERLIAEYPAAKEAEEGLKRLKKLRSKGLAPPELDPQKRFLRGEAFLRAGRAKEAAGEFLSLLDEDGYSGEAALRLARAEMMLGQNSKARKTLERFLDKGPAEAYTLRALGLLSRIALRRADEALLLKVEKRLIEKFPDSSELAMVKIYRGRLYEGRERTKDALESYSEVLDGPFKDLRAREDALWSMGWLRYKNGRYGQAEKIFSEGASKEDGRNVERFRYWAARSAEKRGRLEEAETYYRGLCKNLIESYYCRMAKQRLRGMGRDINEGSTYHTASTTPAPILSGMDTPQKLLSDPVYRKATELLTLGLYSHAARELDLLIRRYTSDPEALVRLTALLYRAGDYHRVLRMLDRYLLEFLKAGTDGISGDLVRLAFPLPVVDYIRKKTDDLSVDPYLVAAIMREESAFDMEVVSGAGAVGLMQIIPETGMFVARNLGHKPFDHQELFDPETNLRFGAWYLGHLAKNFKGDPVLTIAGYNAGPGAVERWTGKGPKELDEFIESIPYPETRAYTKRVLRSYAQFMELAGLNALNLFSRPVPSKPKDRTRASTAAMSLR